MRRAAVLLALTFAITLVVPVAAGAAGRAPVDTAPLKKGLVTAADLPSGWTETAVDTAGDDATAADIAACVGKPVVARKALVSGPDLVDPSGNFMVGSSLAVYATPALAKKQFRIYRSPKYAACAQKHFETTPAGGAGGPLPTSVVVGKVPLDSFGDRTVGFGAQATVPNSDGTTTDATSIQAAVLRGRAIARYEFNGHGGTFDQQTGERLLQTVDRRLTRAKA